MAGMLTDLQRDILIKSAEGIQEGMWCRGSWFSRGAYEGDATGDNWTDTSIIQGDLEPGFARSLHRCAQGELALQTVIAGGDQWDYTAVDTAVSGAIGAKDVCGAIHWGTRFSNIPNHNDVCMKDLDAFTAGQEWARIFREVAEA